MIQEQYEASRGTRESNRALKERLKILGRIFEYKEKYPYLTIRNIAISKGYNPQTIRTWINRDWDKKEYCPKKEK